MEHTGKSEKELQAALKEWYTIDESPATVEQMVEAQNWVVTFFALTSYVTIQDKSIQPPLRNVSHPKASLFMGRSPLRQMALCLSLPHSRRGKKRRWCASSQPLDSHRWTTAP